MINNYLHLFKRLPYGKMLKLNKQLFGILTLQETLLKT